MSMKNMRNLLLLGLFSLLSFTAFSQDKGGLITVIRDGNYVGSAVPFKIFLDGKLVCRLKNHKYSVHNITEGEHTLTIANTGLGSHKVSRGFKVNVVSGQTNYVSVVNARDLFFEEVTQKSGEDIIKRLVEQKDCLGKKK